MKATDWTMDIPIDAPKHWFVFGKLESTHPILTPILPSLCVVMVQRKLLKYKRLRIIETRRRDWE